MYVLLNFFHNLNSTKHSIRTFPDTTCLCSFNRKTWWKTNVMKFECVLRLLRLQVKEAVMRKSDLWNQPWRNTDGRYGTTYIYHSALKPFPRFDIIYPQFWLNDVSLITKCPMLLLFFSSFWPTRRHCSSRALWNEPWLVKHTLSSYEHRATERSLEFLTSWIIKCWMVIMGC